MSFAERHLRIQDRGQPAALSALHLAIISACALGFAFDLWEVALTSVLSAVFAADGHGGSQVSWLLSALYLGALVGAPMFGHAGDRYGRRPVIMGLLLLLGVSSLAAAFAPSLAWVTVFRFFGGMAIGAYPPVMFAYLGDILPPARRGPTLVLVSAAAALGAPLAIFLVRGLSPDAPFGLEAWRWAFLLGGAGAALTAAAFIGLPESPRWLLSVGRSAHADAGMSRFVASRPVLRAGRKARRTSVAGEAPAPPVRPARAWAAMLALFLLSGWALNAFPAVSGPILLAKGFRLDDTLLYVGVAAFGPPVGSLAASAVIDTIGRRLALGLCALALIVAIIAFVVAAAPASLMLSGLAFNLAGLIYIPVLYILATEVFPTRSRSFAVALCWACNRLGAALAPLVLLPMLATHGAPSVAAVMVGALGASLAVIVALAPRGAAGRAVP